MLEGQNNLIFHQQIPQEQELRLLQYLQYAFLY